MRLLKNQTIMPAPKNNKNASIFNMEIVEEVCDLVADGLNIKDALRRDPKYPSFETWRRWKNDNDVVCALYIKAIQDKAESVDAKIDEIWEGCRNGQYDASTANVLIQTLKWKASKYYPKMFGDKLDIDHTTKGKEIMQPIFGINPLEDE